MPSATTGSAVWINSYAAVAQRICNGVSYREADDEVLVRVRPDVDHPTPRAGPRAGRAALRDSRRCVASASGREPATFTRTLCKMRMPYAPSWLHHTHGAGRLPGGPLMPASQNPTRECSRSTALRCWWAPWMGAVSISFGAQKMVRRAPRARVCPSGVGAPEP